MKRYIALILLVWTLLIAGAIGWNLLTERRHVEEEARIEARAIWDHNLSYRKWITAMGGVYVRRDKLTPNPYLAIPDRDKKTSDGISLTMANPAYMTGEVFEIIRKESDLPIINRIVSENYINPRNKPDTWEAEGLHSFVDGKNELSEITMMNGQPYMRLFKPMTTAEGCLRCHGQQGYKVGDIRGGISVSVPMQPYYAIETQESRRILIAFLALWTVGSGSIIVFFRSLAKKEELVQESEEKYRMLVESANDAVMVHTIVEGDRPGRFFLVNELACERFGYTREEFARLSPQELNDPQHLDHIPAVMEKLQRDGRAVFESVMVKKDGGRVPVEISTRLLRIKGYPYIVSLVRDISERKQMEESLRFEEQRYRSLFESVPDALIIAELDTGILCDANRSAERLFGRSREELIGMHQSRLHPERIEPRTTASFRAHAAEAREGRISGPFEHIVLRSDGSEIPVEIVTQPVTLGGQKMIQAVFRDIAERKRAEATLRRSEESLRTREHFLNESQRVGQVGGWDWDAGHDVIWWSDEYYRIYGIEPGTQPPNYRDHLKAYTPESAARLDTVVQRALKTGEPYELDLELARPTAQTRWIVARGEAKRDESGRIWGLRGTAQNITERKRSEEALRRSEQFLDSIIENIPNMIFVKDAETLRFVRFNRAGERLLGWPRKDLLGKNDYDIFPKGEAAFFTAKDREAIAKDEVTDIAHEEIRTRSGAVRVLHTQKIPIRNDAGVPQFLLGISEDITERKATESALRKSQAFVRDILESVDEGFIVVGRDYRIQSANRAFCRFTGVAESEAPGSFCYAVSHRISKPCYEAGEECPVKRTFETGAPHSVTHTHQDPAGGKQYVDIRTYPVMDESGSVVSAIETMNDITDKRRLEDQLRQSQKMEAVGTLAGGVAHDFNNILTAIIGYGNIVKMKMSADDPLHNAVEQVLAASQRAADLTRALLTFSRKQVLNPRPTDVNTTVQSVQKLLLRLIGEDIELSTSLEQEQLVVMADPGQIEQVLMNLATNARDAMPEGGTLAISTGIADVTEDFVSVHGYGKAGKYALISVSDSGQGMDERTREKIFEPFFTTKELGKGTGLGLAIVYGIIKQHNGNINVYSEPGKGTTFKIYLPLVVPEEAQGRSSEVAPQPPGGTETILLAEDDQTVRQLTATILRDFGYQVIEAADGQDAVRQFETHADRVRLLILDVIMPRKTGKDAFAEIEAKGHGTPVLFMSGYTADILQKRGIFELDSDRVAFLTKPINPEELLRKVRELFDRKGGGGEGKPGQLV